MTAKEILQSEVAEAFREYLIATGQRQTRERFAILRAAYDIEGTFTIDTLSEVMNQHRFHVSTATLYQTMQLLVEANLLIRHPLSSSCAVFERIDDRRARCYQVCSCCHSVKRLRSKALTMGIDAYYPRSFTPTHRILYVYGTCNKCLRKQKAKNN